MAETPSSKERKFEAGHGKSHLAELGRSSAAPLHNLAEPRHLAEPRNLAMPRGVSQQSISCDAKN
jgi:hypothetical protein